MCSHHITSFNIIIQYHYADISGQNGRNIIKKRRFVSPHSCHLPRESTHSVELSYINYVVNPLFFYL